MQLCRQIGSVGGQIGRNGPIAGQRTYMSIHIADLLSSQLLSQRIVLGGAMRFTRPGVLKPDPILVHIEVRARVIRNGGREMPIE